ncbi:MAG: alpha/beta hydrolase [Bacteroidota bacterium]
MSRRSRGRAPFSAEDLYGVARLGTDAVAGVTDLVEAVHATVASPVGRPLRTRGIAGAVYRAIRTVTAWVRRGLDGTWALGDARRERAAPPADSPTREALIAALNGVLGDALAAQDHPLATPTHVRYHGRPLALDASSLAAAVSDPRETVLVRVHGICMHDGQWVESGAPDALAAGLGATPVALRYNSGRHISENGRDLAGALDALVRAWPRPVSRLVVVGHSMGGLVARSAFHYGAEAGHGWPAAGAALVTLGSPHHGAPLERAGSVVDALLDATRWTAPFARIGRVRSAGVTDLRFGNVLDEDWAGHERPPRGDARHPLPLPAGVTCYLVAAVIAEDSEGRLRRGAGHWVGDGLVPVASALGRHPDPDRRLAVPPGRTWTAVGMDHFDLIRRPEVTAKLLEWLAPKVRSAGAAVGSP